MPLPTSYFPAIKIYKGHSGANPSKQPSYTSNSQSGLTLVELMVSLSLGMLISALAIQLFINSLHAQRAQQSAMDVHSTAVFNLAYLKKEIEKANYGSNRAMTQDSAWTGIVLTGSEDIRGVSTVDSSLISTSFTYPTSLGNLRGAKNLDDGLLSASQVGPSNIAGSKIGNSEPIKSDQLTLQYQAPFDSYDCEGRKINKGEQVIERFFTAIDNQRASNETSDLAIALKCDAGRVDLDSINNERNEGTDIRPNSISITGLGSRSVVLINRVDYFEVKLGVLLKNGITYLTINDYLQLKSGGSSSATLQNRYLYNGPIVAVQFGVISRGNSAVVTSGRSTLMLNGTLRTIKEQMPFYVRRTYQGVVALRNSNLSKTSQQSVKISDTPILNPLKLPSPIFATNVNVTDGG